SMHGVAPDILTKLYNACLKYRCFPLWFKHSVVKAIPKQSAADPQSAKSWRPISLISVPGKILERLMISRVMHSLNLRNQLSPNQFGFTPQKSTVDAIGTVVDDI